MEIVNAAIKLVLFVAVSWLFLIAPNILNRKYDLQSITGWDYAHRGLHNNADKRPENSKTAFLAAAEKGYGIELDIRLTRDRKMVVFHDESLERMCGDKRAVRNVPLREIKEMRLIGSEETIPTFDEALETISGRVPVIIEIKTDYQEKNLASMVYDRLTSYTGAYCVESFDPMMIRWFKKYAPHIVRGQLAYDCKITGTSYKHFYDIPLAFMLFNVFSRPDFIAYGFKTDKNVTFRAVSKIFRPLLVAWTVQDLETYRELRSRYDILIFEGFEPASIGKNKKGAVI